MRCSCGQPGTIVTRRRTMPYCEACFLAHLARLVRADAGPGPVLLQSTQDEWEQGARALAALARREVKTSPSGAIPGCAERAAAYALAYLFGDAPTDAHVFPASVTLEELQTFFKPASLIILSELERDVSALESTYPGSVRAILHSASDRAQSHATPQPTR